MTTAATIYMSLVGPHGLETIASNSHANTMLVKEKLTAIDGVEAIEILKREQVSLLVTDLQMPKVDGLEEG